MKKLLVICGPTATGKTSLALKLSKQFDAEILSADSRQVYKGMDIGTGKDLPSKAELVTKDSSVGGYYVIDQVPIWGYDLANPSSEFSVSQYQRITRSIIQDIWRRDKLPILVGGTGFYIKAVVDGIDTISIPVDTKLRTDLLHKSSSELYEILKGLDKTKSESMNFSDRQNPRRLIRAIEVAHNSSKKKDFPLEADLLLIGLIAEKKILDELISKRVSQRIDAGFEKEINDLLAAGVDWNSQAMASLGYRQWHEYLEGNLDREEAINLWVKEEQRYAKRQITWFKKDPRIIWFDTTDPDFRQKVEETTKKWHNIDERKIYAKKS